MRIPGELLEIIITYAISDYRAFYSLTRVCKNFYKICHKNVSYELVAGSFQQPKQKLRKFCLRYMDMHLRTFPQYCVPKQLLAGLFYSRPVDLLDCPLISDNKIEKYAQDLSRLCNLRILNFDRLARAYILALKNQASSLPLYRYRGMDVFQKLAHEYVDRNTVRLWYSTLVNDCYYLPSLKGNFYYALDKSESLDINRLSE